MSTFLPYFEGVRERTRRVVQLVPDDQIEWRATEGKFSFGDLVRHLAAFERYVFGENIAGRESRYPGHGRELADGAEAVRRYLEVMHGETVEIFRGIADEDLATRCTTPAGASIRKRSWLRAMVEHEAHHRGQIYLMLGMIGVRTPPIFGLSSEQVRERSLWRSG